VNTRTTTTRPGGHGVIKANDPCWCGSGRKYKRCHRGTEGRILPGRVSPMRGVPDNIAPTDYYPSGEPIRRDESMVKSPEIIERMRVAGRIAAEVLDVTGRAAAPGVTTEELDRIAHEAYIERGSFPSTLNYHGYPKSICTSVNEVICHGIPDDRPLEDGDIVNVDVTAYIDGVHGDCSATYLIGDVDAESTALVDVTRECRDLGIAAVQPGLPVNVIGRAIEQHAHAHGYGVVRSFVGHGIGEQFHISPTIPHYYSADAATIMQPGMTFTVEPMITLGSWREKMWDNGWTAVTSDGRRTAQFEHTLVVTEDGAEILTLVP
jgi:methionyl aminopeptidase